MQQDAAGSIVSCGAQAGKHQKHTFSTIAENECKKLIALELETNMAMNRPARRTVKSRGSAIEESTA
jgi:hypothetical protein